MRRVEVGDVKKFKKKKTIEEWEPRKRGHRLKTISIQRNRAIEKHVRRKFIFKWLKRILISMIKSRNFVINVRTERICP